MKLLFDKLGKPHTLISYVADRLGHDWRYAIDSAFALQELKWKPLHNVREGLESTIDWYLNNRGWWKALLERTGALLNASQAKACFGLRPVAAPFSTRAVHGLEGLVPIPRSWKAE